MELKFDGTSNGKVNSSLSFLEFLTKIQEVFSNHKGGFLKIEYSKDNPDIFDFSDSSIEGYLPLIRNKYSKSFPFSYSLSIYNLTEDDFDY